MVRDSCFHGSIRKSRGFSDLTQFIATCSTKPVKESLMNIDSQHDTITLLNARLLRLERSNRKTAWLAATAAATVIVVVLAAGAMPNQVPDKIEAKQFVLRSPDGKVIAELGADPLGDEPYFHLFDKKGDVRFAVDTQGLMICKRFGDDRVTTTGRIILNQLPDGECSLLFRDDQGRSRLQVGLTKDNTPVLEIWDSNLASRIKLTLDQKSDAPFVSIRLDR